MIEVFFALAPVFILILLGYFFKAKAIVKPDFWEGAEHLTYYVFFPALLFYTTARAQVDGLDIIPLVAVVLVAKTLTAALTVRLRYILETDGPSFTSVFQGSIRFNTYVALAGASALWGDAGVTLVAIAAVVTVPLVNILCIIVMETYGDSAHRSSRPNWRRYGRAVVTNPLIVASFLGGAFNLTGLSLPPVIEPFLEILARAALPLGLLCVGAGLIMTDIGRKRKAVFSASVLKLFVLPAIMFFACLAFGVEGMTRDVLVFFGAMPVATASYVLARKMGGDSTVMASIITVTTLLAMVTLPLTYWLMEAL